MRKKNLYAGFRKGPARGSQQKAMQDFPRKGQTMGKQAHRPQKKRLEHLAAGLMP